MDSIESQSYRAGHNPRNFFIPDRLSVTLYFLLGAILLMIFSLDSLLNLLDVSYLEPSNKLSANLEIVSSSVNKSVGTAFGGRLGQIIVWSLIGAVIYLCFWFFKNIFNSFENDMIIQHYRHPGDFDKTGYWGSALSAKVFFAALAIVLITYTYMALKIFLPAASTLARTAAYDFRLPSSVIYLIIALLIPAAAVYLWVLLARLIAHLWKLL